VTIGPKPYGRGPTVADVNPQTVITERVDAMLIP